MAKKTRKLPNAGAGTGLGRLQKIQLQKKGTMVLEGEKGSSRGDRKSRS